MIPSHTLHLSEELKQPQENSNPEAISPDIDLPPPPPHHQASLQDNSAGTPDRKIESRESEECLDNTEESRGIQRR